MCSCLTLDYILEFDRGARLGIARIFHAVPSGAFFRDRYRRVLDLAVFLEFVTTDRSLDFEACFARFSQASKKNPTQAPGLVGLIPWVKSRYAKGVFQVCAPRT